MPAAAKTGLTSVAAISSCPPWRHQQEKQLVAAVRTGRVRLRLRRTTKASDDRPSSAWCRVTSAVRAKYLRSGFREYGVRASEVAGDSACRDLPYPQPWRRADLPHAKQVRLRGDCRPLDSEERQDQAGVAVTRETGGGRLSCLLSPQFYVSHSRGLLPSQETQAHRIDAEPGGGPALGAVRI